MKPIGTITKYFPFIDEESRSILNSLMDESSTYFDFVHRLAELVLEKEVSDNLVYIATTQLWYICEKSLINTIVAKYELNMSIKPWIFQWGTSESFHLNNYQAILESLDLVSNLPADNWITTELLLGHSYNLAVRPEAVNILSTAKAILNRQSDLMCFEPLEYIAEGRMNYQEGKVPSAIASCHKGFELATTNDDVVFAFFSILSLATYVKDNNPMESLEQFEQAYQIALELGVPVFIGEALHGASMAYEILGEYDLAISCEFECLNEFSVFGNEIPYSTLSRVYVTLGDGQRALEWAERALDDKDYFAGYLDKARALIVLNRLDEAETLLEIAGRKILQVGNDEYMARHYFVSGLLEMAKGESTTSMATLEQAYEILYPLGKLIHINEILVSLAQVEIALFKQSRKSDEVPLGKWLSALETHGRTFHMPGIRMQAALLKSEFYQNHGQLKDAQAVLRDALDITNSPGVTTLRRKITAKIQEIEKHLHDEEIVS